MIAIAWLVVALWGAVLLSTARPTLKRLPKATRIVPPYALWLPDGGAPPTLEPAPDRVFVGPERPTEGPERLLVLGQGVTVPVDLPGRLVACGVDFVSVFPQPKGGWLGLAVERLWRDFAGPLNVVNPRHPAAFADARCAWLRRRDLDLDAPGIEPILRAARARKAYGLSVDLRDGRAGFAPSRGLNGATLVAAPAHSARTHVARFGDLVGGDGVVALLLRSVPVGLCLAPWALLPFADLRAPALLAIGLGSGARLMTAVRDGFGYALPVLGWIAEPALALAAIRARPLPLPPMPETPTGSAPGLVAPRAVEGGAWLDAAGLPFLARRLGGSAQVMEQLYENRPTGRTIRGRAVDRGVHLSPGARAVRHRLVATIELVQALAPRRLLSVPCGSARDAAAIAAPHMTLVDPDPRARRLARARCPDATVLAGRVEDVPEGPFDVVLFVGLLEYLADDEALRVLMLLRGRLDPAGALVVTTTDEYTDRARMAHWLGWETKARTPDSLARLLDAAGYQVESRQADPNQIQWVMLARPRPMA